MANQRVKQENAEITAFAKAMRARARYGHERVVAEEVPASRFMSVGDMLAGAQRNLAQVEQAALLVEQGHGVDMARVLDAAADASNYLRMAVAKMSPEGK